MVQGSTSQKAPRHQHIIEEPAQVRRIRRKHALARLSSEGTVSAGVMVLGAIIAVIVANTPAYPHIQEFLEIPLEIRLGSFVLSLTLESLVNDGLMTLFFLIVGVELKYEMTVGHLTHPRQAMLPMLAAVGGVAVPALIYMALNWNGAREGWAMPIATDIAFALGVMALLGDRVAPATKVFFSTLAIADDIIAIVVIALFYGQTPDISWCLASLAMTLVLFGINRAKVYTVRNYVVAGVALWVCMFYSGLHPTLAGVIIAFSLPTRSDIRLSELSPWLTWQARSLKEDFDEDSKVLSQHEFTQTAAHAERILHHVTPPLQRVHRNLSVVVSFVVLPLFAFINAQVRVVDVDLLQIVTSPVAQGTFLGAVLGKPIGIVSVTLVLSHLGFATLPEGLTRKQVVAVGIMGGIGFTMSILVSGLAFTNPSQILVAKCAVLAGSVFPAVLGCLFVMLFCRQDEEETTEEEE